MNGAVFLPLHKMHGLWKEGRGAGVSSGLCLVAEIARGVRQRPISINVG